MCKDGVFFLKKSETEPQDFKKGNQIISLGESEKSENRKKYLFW